MSCSLPKIPKLYWNLTQSFSYLNVAQHRVYIPNAIFLSFELRTSLSFHSAFLKVYTDGKCLQQQSLHFERRASNCRWKFCVCKCVRDKEDSANRMLNNTREAGQRAAGTLLLNYRLGASPIAKIWPMHKYPQIFQNTFQTQACRA